MRKTYSPAAKLLNYFSLSLASLVLCLINLSLIPNCGSHEHHLESIAFKDAPAALTQAMCQSSIACCQQFNHITFNTCTRIINSRLQPLWQKAQTKVTNKKMIYHGDKFKQFIDSLKLIASNCQEGMNNALVNQSLTGNLPLGSTCNPDPIFNECLNGYCDPYTNSCSQIVPLNQPCVLLTSTDACGEDAYCHNTHQCIPKYTSNDIGKACDADQDCLKGSCVNNLCSANLCGTPKQNAH